MSNATGCPISKPICINEFYQDFKQENVIECSYFSTNTNDVGPDILDKDEKSRNQIINNCSLNLLDCDYNKYLWDEIKFVTPREKTNNNQFKTFEYFQKSLSEHGSVNELMMRCNRKSQLPKDLSYDNSRDVTSISSNDKDKLKFIIDDVLITVIVFKPLGKFSNETNSTNLIRYLKPEIRIDLLGSQTLEDLLKMIKCKNDETFLGDFSDVMNDWNNYKVYSKDAYKGGFFLIEDVFYDIEDGEDFSTPIINWVSKSSERIEQFGILEKKSMKGVKLTDMKFCVGQPYLYQHLGDCEHFFVFSDIRLINKYDCQDPNMYPIVTGKSKYKTIKCNLCEQANSEWLVTDCDIAPTDKLVTCDYCLRMFLYDETYKKAEDVGDFKVLRLPSFL